MFGAANGYMHGFTTPYTSAQTSGKLSADMAINKMRIMRVDDRWDKLAKTVPYLTPPDPPFLLSVSAVVGAVFAVEGVSLATLPLLPEVRTEKGERYICRRPRPALRNAPASMAGDVPEDLYNMTLALVAMKDITTNLTAPNTPRRR
ncbi:hypothetical protein P691DRAFT_771939 [Macrolepiota fuliginosa MF-IS2]|uniref:Uncharacterized protein n=1 Tax=Macrolepiota fuliginosa MF-IS2 TaxID=1400762 RepID=A0A9P6C940_9AGAR|nr:hypothetical protein P691DRAFT_771939 [Macrolepiota fuliginosa MF-IS2]